MALIRIMIADDHGLVRQGLSAILEQEDDMIVIGKANSGEALLTQIKSGACPDVVLMDVYMDGMSGIEATEQLKRLRPTVHIIAVSAADTEQTIQAMLEVGACKFIDKASNASELVKAVRDACAQGAGSMQERKPPVIAKAESRLQQTRSAYHPSASGLQTLTRPQLEVVKLLIQGHSNKKIAQYLEMSEARVELYLTNIFATLGVTSRREAIMTLTHSDQLVHHESNLLVAKEIELNADCHMVTVHGQTVDLTPTEYQVLFHLMSMPDQAVSKQDLLRHVWHSDFERNPNLVQVTILRLRKKIEADPTRPRYILTVQRVGYKFCTRPELSLAKINTRNRALGQQNYNFHPAI
jgi:DNA-binding NarL/FixJ family response regulator/DNA-binding winged helix-turn-helix (wHTH) protein